MLKCKSIVWLFCCTVLLLGIVLASHAAAFGIGFYGGGGSATGDVEMDPKNSGSNYSFEAKNKHSNYGLVLDTAVAKDTLFNYRLNLGYESYSSKDRFGYALKMTGLVLDNDFGFGVVRSGQVRIWLGPELRIAYLSGDDSNSDYNQFGIGIGPAGGVNVNLGEVMAIAFKVSYLFNSYSGEMKGKRTSLNDATFTMTEGLPNVNLALIFRFGAD